ncbi:alpha-ketoglutarate-dependent 2-4-dichlorophenoxyacetate dioxygenase [Penicillium chermesinum]|nr:alpha-ketoglutarate-dependent 2-4-dichlorophenoxyacetate dioxygenase [Penicillium chermesinum]
MFKHISIEELHPTFGAEVSGVDFSKSLDDEVFEEIKQAIYKYGVLVFRDTGITDELHVEFGERFGEIEDASPFVKDGKYRLSDTRLFDLSNMDADGNIVVPETLHGVWNKLPPPGNGGTTEFADLRAAFDDLPEEQKNELRTKGYIGSHSVWHSRQLASPEVEILWKFKPDEHPVSKHKIYQIHEGSGRETLYIASHIFRIDGMSQEEFDAFYPPLYAFAQRPENIFSVEWKQPGDIVMWDNTSVMHRGTGGNFTGKYRRDMRRATVYDGGKEGWGVNQRDAQFQGLLQEASG